MFVNYGHNLGLWPKPVPGHVYQIIPDSRAPFSRLTGRDTIPVLCRTPANVSGFHPVGCCRVQNPRMSLPQVFAHIQAKSIPFCSALSGTSFPTPCRNRPGVTQQYLAPLRIQTKNLTESLPIIIFGGNFLRPNKSTHFYVIKFKIR